MSLSIFLGELIRACFSGWLRTDYGAFQSPQEASPAVKTPHRGGAAYRSYLHREGPRALGSKEIPQVQHTGDSYVTVCDLSQQNVYLRWRAGLRCSHVIGWNIGAGIVVEMAIWQVDVCCFKTFKLLFHLLKNTPKYGQSMSPLDSNMSRVGVHWTQIWAE